MIKFKTLTIKNFLSYGAVPTVIDLDQAGTTLILGEDLDNTASGAGANGCGKTVIINALTYGIYDKPISDISKDNLVNNINKKNMEVTIEFEVNGTEYLVKRVRKAKAGAAGNYVQFFADGKDITPDSVGNTNALIESIIGIPYEIFVRVAAFSANHIPFLDLPVRSPHAANQTDIIEELFDLKTLSEKAVSLKDAIKDAEQSLEIQRARVDQLEKEKARHLIQLETAEKRVVNWDTQNRAEIETILQKLKKLEDVDVDSQRNLHDELTSINNDLTAALATQRSIERSISLKAKIIGNKTKELSHLKDDKCPYCLQQYADANLKIDECDAELATVKAELEKLEQELTAIDDFVENLELDRDMISARITVADMDELLEIKSKASHYNKRVKELRQTENPFVEPLRELQDIVFESASMDKINELTSLIEHQKFLHKLLTKKDSFVRKALLNKNIPFLNSRLANYLNELGLPHTVEFTHEMTASISQFGRPLDFGNLSNGQRARVNLALSFAFRDVLQSVHGHINVCMLDEALDVGLDTVGVQNAARMLKRKARDEGLSMFIISHRDEIDNAFDRKIVVQMSKGFSSITEME